MWKTRNVRVPVSAASVRPPDSAEARAYHVQTPLGSVAEATSVRGARVAEPSDRSIQSVPFVVQKKVTYVRIPFPSSSRARDASPTENRTVAPETVSATSPNVGAPSVRNDAGAVSIAWTPLSATSFHQ